MITFLTAFAGVVTAGMNVYTYVTTNGMIDTMLKRGDRQIETQAEQFKLLKGVLDRSQDQLDRTQDQFERVLDRLLDAVADR